MFTGGGHLVLARRLFEVGNELNTVCSPPNVQLRLPPFPDHNPWMTLVTLTTMRTLI